MDNKATSTAEPGLFMTDATARLAGKDLIEGIEAGMPADQHIVLISSPDFLEDKATPDLKAQFHAAGVKPSSIMESAVEGVFAQKALSSGSTMASTGLNGTFIIKKEADATFQFPYPVASNACFVTIPLKSTFQEPDGTVRVRSPREYAETMLGVEPGWLEDDTIPGTEQDIELWVAHHETDHCNNSEHAFAEYESDTHANQQYALDLAAGRASDPELPYYMRSQRAGSFMLGVTDSAYNANGLTPLAGETPLTESQLGEASQQIDEAKDRVYDAITQDLNREGKPVDLETMWSIDLAPMVYEESRHQLAQGNLDDLPYGKTMVERFVDGAQRYGHVLYSVSLFDKQNEPPVMPLAAYGQSVMTLSERVNSNKDPAPTTP